MKKPTSMAPRRRKSRSSNSASAKQNKSKQRSFSDQLAQELLDGPIKRTFSEGNRANLSALPTAPLLHEERLPPGWTGGLGMFGKVWYIHSKTGKNQLAFPLPPGWTFSEKGEFVSSKGEIVPLGEFPESWE